MAGLAYHVARSSKTNLGFSAIFQYDTPITMPRVRMATDLKEHIAVQHRVTLGLTALTLGAAALGLSVALLASPSGVSDQLFQSTSAPVFSNSTADAVTVTWTAPGDDGSTGQAAEYDLRYATAPLTANNFSQATRVTGLLPPAPAGSTESFTVNSLSPDTTYYFALKTADEAGNLSSISNVLAVTTAAGPQSCVPQYQCSVWSECINGLMTRTCNVTNGCPSGLGAPVTQQSCGTGGGQAEVTNPVVVAALGPGDRPKVRTLNPRSLSVRKEFNAFSTSNRNGVFVAAGDVTGDGRADIIVGSGKTSTSTVRIFSDAGTLLYSFNPFGSRNTGGATVATGDVDGDGRAEIIAAPASGSGAIRVYRYDSSLRKVTQIGTISVVGYSGGYNVVSADFDLNGADELAVAKKAGGSGVTTYRWNGASFIKRSAWRAYPVTFSSGLVLAAGDVTGDGRPEIVTAGGTGYWTDLKVFTSTGTQVTHVLPFSKSFFGGSNLTTKDVNDDGQEEILVSPASGAGPFIRTFRFNQVTRQLNRIKSQNVFPASIRTGLRLGDA